MGNVHLVTGYAGKAHVQAADTGSFNVAMYDNNEFVFNRGNMFQASIVTNNKVRVLDGDLLMQGRHIRLNEGSYVDLIIENGQQSLKRYDLIVARYTKDAVTSVEDVNLVVIKGTAAESPADPAHTSGDLLEAHDVLNDMPLFRVKLDGLNIEGIDTLYKSALPFTTWISNVSAKAKEAATAAQNAQDTADAASTKANAAMPKAGGTFTGQAVAYSTNRTQSDLRNCVICNSSWTAVSTNRLIFLRK